MESVITHLIIQSAQNGLNHAPSLRERVVTKSQKHCMYKYIDKLARISPNSQTIDVQIIFAHHSDARFSRAIGKSRLHKAPRNAIGKSRLHKAPRSWRYKRALGNRGYIKPLVTRLGNRGYIKPLVAGAIDIQINILTF